MTKRQRIPDAVLNSHIAVLGKTGSGKTSTEKLAVEQAAADGFRVCVLDIVKSDWWGITSSASGKSAGLSFKILGGPRGHVPLHSSAGKVIGQLVGSGKLPLSIIDMADFEPGGIQRFFVDFAQALWKSTRGVVYLVVEEAHEIAPKERAGFGAENMAIHWAKKLATGSRSKGIRLIVATQSVQQLHNRVLGSCETLIAHRLTTPADQEPVVKWMQANADKATVEKVKASLSSLPTGTAWLCSGEARIFEQVSFPKFKTFDNTTTPIDDAAEVDVKTAAVDQDELRELIGDAVKQAEATDVKALQKKVTTLEQQLRTRPAETTTVTVKDEAAIAKAEERGFERGKKEVASAADRQIREARLTDLQGLHDLTAPLVDFLIGELKRAKADKNKIAASVAFAPTPIQPGSPAPLTAGAKPPGRAAGGATTARANPSPAASGDGTLTGSEQRIVDAIRWWNVFGIPAPSHAQVGFVAGYSHKSGTWSTYLSRLRSAGMIEGRGDLVLTTEGAAAANEPDAPPTGEQLRAEVLNKIDGPLRKIMVPILEVYPQGLAHADAGERTGYSHQSGTWSTYLSRLRSLDLIDGRGELRAQNWLFP